MFHYIFCPHYEIPNQYTHSVILPILLYKIKATIIDMDFDILKEKIENLRLKDIMDFKNLIDFTLLLKGEIENNLDEEDLIKLKLKSDRSNWVKISLFLMTNPEAKIILNKNWIESSYNEPSVNQQIENELKKYFENAKELNINFRSVSNALQNLEKMNLLDTTKHWRRNFYFEKMDYYMEFLEYCSKFYSENSNLSTQKQNVKSSLLSKSKNENTSINFIHSKLENISTDILDIDLVGNHWGIILEFTKPPFKIVNHDTLQARKMWLNVYYYKTKIDSINERNSRIRTLPFIENEYEIRLWKEYSLQNDFEKFKSNLKPYLIHNNFLEKEQISQELPYSFVLKELLIKAINQSKIVYQKNHFFSLPSVIIFFKKRNNPLKNIDFFLRQGSFYSRSGKPKGLLSLYKIINYNYYLSKEYVPSNPSVTLLLGISIDPNDAKLFKYLNNDENFKLKDFPYDIKKFLTYDTKYLVNFEKNFKRKIIGPFLEKEYYINDENINLLKKNIERLKKNNFINKNSFTMLSDILKTYNSQNRHDHIFNVYRDLEKFVPIKKLKQIKKIYFHNIIYNSYYLILKSNVIEFITVDFKHISLFPLKIDSLNISPFAKFSRIFYIADKIIKYFDYLDSLNEIYSFDSLFDIFSTSIE